MNCYAGLARRIVKSCFLEVKPHKVIPVTQLEPLDASKIIKQEAYVALSDVSQEKLANQQTYWTHEHLFNPKPISDEEAWEATLAWAEAKAQEREAAALKAVSETDTDESYDSDESKVGVQTQPVLKKGISLFGDDSDDDASSSEDDEEFPLAAVACLMRRGTNLEEKKAWSLSDAAAAAAMWRDDAQAAAEESVAAKKALEALDKRSPSPRKYTAATIIQAAERGRALRAWKAQFTDELAHEMSHIWRARYHTRMGMDAVEQQLAEQWMVSPKCVKAWILLGEQRSASADLVRVSVV